VTVTDLQAHDDTQARIWDDKRMPPGTRELALAMAWVLHREPQHAPGKEYWTRVRVLLGHQPDLASRWRIHQLLAGDVPFYQPPGHWSGKGPCEGPRLRPYRPRRAAQPGGSIIYQVPGWTPPPEHDSRVCGALAGHQVAEHDMVTGWVTCHWFCRRHLDRATEVEAQLAARGDPPEPIPNRGGLLPGHFAADWATVYSKAAARAEGALGLQLVGWQPPYYGVNADDWPIPGKTVVPKRPRLSLVVPG
jgi:hypothetical protein